MSAASAFYDDPDLKDGFGSTAPPRKNSHRGLDFGHALGTPVPALAGGVVVISQWDDALGNVIEVRNDFGRFDGYRHLRTAGRAKAKVGDRVEFDQIIGEVSDTGSAAYGYHLCQTNAVAQGGVFGSSALVTDPWPWIKFYVYGGPNPGGQNATGFERAPGGEPGAPLWPVGDLMARLQRGLSKRGRYNFENGSPRPDDGKGGHFTAVGIQRTLNVSGFNGPTDVPRHSRPTPEDGKLGRNNGYGIQRYAAEYGGYANVIDGDPQYNSYVGLCVGLETD